MPARCRQTSQNPPVAVIHKLLSAVYTAANHRRPFVMELNFPPVAGGAVVCWACSTVYEMRLLYQPDGGEEMRGARASSQGGVRRKCGAKLRSDKQEPDKRLLWPDEWARSYEKLPSRLKRRLLRTRNSFPSSLHVLRGGQTSHRCLADFMADSRSSGLVAA
jgi:hypothetical protein